MINIETRSGETFNISTLPGIYTIGGAFRIVHDGTHYLYLPGTNPSESDLNHLDWRLMQKIEGNKIKLG